MAKAGLPAFGESQPANSFPAAPDGAPGVPSFRSLVLGDLPAAIPQSNQLNSGSNDFWTVQTLGSAIKGNTPGNVIYSTTNTFSMVNTQAIAQAMTVPVAATLTGCKLWFNITAVYTPTGYNGVGLYSINPATGLLTQIAAATSSPTVWAQPAGVALFPFSAPIAVAAGVYYLVWLYQNSAQTTAPRIFYINNNGVPEIMDFPNSIKLQGALTLSSLPATIASSAIGASGVLFYSILY